MQKTWCYNEMMKSTWKGQNPKWSITDVYLWFVTGDRWPWPWSVCGSAVQGQNEDTGGQTEGNYKIHPPPPHTHTNRHILIWLGLPFHWIRPHIHSKAFVIFSQYYEKKSLVYSMFTFCMYIIFNRMCIFLFPKIFFLNFYFFFFSNKREVRCY